MTDTPQIRRRPDGSIDTAFFLEKGRLERSKAAHGTAKKATRSARGVGVVLATFGLALLFRGGQV